MMVRKEETTALWQQYLDTREIEIRNELVARYAHLVHSHANRLAQRLSLQVGVDEIASAAFDGLLSAVETFDLERKVKFETYAAKRIVGAVYDWLRSVDTQSRAVRQFERRRHDVMMMAKCDTGDLVPTEEMARRMDMTVQQFERYTRRSRTGRFVPLSSLSGSEDNGNPRGLSAGNIPCASQPAPSDRIANDLLRDYLCRGLCQTERTVLLLYYYDGLTMAEVGSTMGLSESRVSQIHKQVLRALRHRFEHPEARCAIA